MASYLHGAVSVNGDYMVLMGGVGVSSNAIVQLYVYVYACNRWIDIAALDTGKLVVMICSGRWNSAADMPSRLGFYLLTSYDEYHNSIQSVVNRPRDADGQNRDNPIDLPSYKDYSDCL